MSGCRLILVEGIPGSGKTTLARRLGDLLEARGVPARVVVEGDLSHPADFEQVAHFDRAAYDDFLARHAAQAELLRAHTEIHGDDHLVPYGLLHARFPRTVDPEIVGELAARDVYEAAPATYRRLAVDRWERFAAGDGGLDEVTVVESCFLQNPLTLLLAKHDLAPDVATAHVRDLVGAVGSLSPLLIYLWQEDCRATIERVAAERSAGWLCFVIDYVTGQSWGQARGASGFDGAVDFYRRRRDLELALVPRLALESLVVENSDQADAAARIVGQVASRL